LDSVSVVICTYRRQKWVEDLLVSVSQQTVLPIEVLIVDSTPDTIDYTLPQGLTINLIKSDVMQLTYQRNLGVRAAKGEIILHLDDDTYLKPDFIEKIMNVFLADEAKAIGAVSGYVTNQWGVSKVTPENNMKWFKRLGLYDGDYSPGSISPSGIFVELNALQPFKGIGKTDFLSGCSFAVRAEVYNKHQHPEVINKYGGEDKIFSRMIASDWGLYIAGDAELEHYSAPGGARQSDYEETKSTVKFHLYAKKKYGKSDSNTTELRLYYILSALRILGISIIMFISIIKISKSKIWFMRSVGYAAGALSRVGIDE
jgi:glycosyltransferase involved in cell wall biosynthesis